MPRQIAWRRHDDIKRHFDPYNFSIKILCRVPFMRAFRHHDEQINVIYHFFPFTRG